MHSAKLSSPWIPVARPFYQVCHILGESMRGEGEGDGEGERGRERGGRGGGGEIAGERKREREGGEVCERERETSFFLSSFLRPIPFSFSVSFFLPSFILPHSLSACPPPLSSFSFLLFLPVFSSCMSWGKSTMMYFHSTSFMLFQSRLFATTF